MENACDDDLKKTHKQPYTNLFPAVVKAIGADAAADAGGDAVTDLGQQLRFGQIELLHALLDVQLRFGAELLRQLLHYLVGVCGMFSTATNLLLIDCRVCSAVGMCDGMRDRLMIEFELS